MGAGSQDIPPVGHAPVAAMVESIVGCKWSLAVLAAIRGGARRPGELERACVGISAKVLNQRLRKMQRFGILTRRSYPEVPPRVEYDLTEFGEAFTALLDTIDVLELRVRRGEFES
ncbi:MAG: winged helix-turn-helix transcriptional regulator [Gemmatimonadota bacterium]|nr:winged helix-turn-helix transcriptional regulator [Gemmatimonadota bacterium]